MLDESSNLCKYLTAVLQQRHAEELNMTASRPNQRQKHPDGRTLPRTIGPKKTKHFSSMDNEVYIVDCPARLVSLTEVVGLQQYGGHACP
jgi:hypothetical protein